MTFVPGGFFANAHATRHEVAHDIDNALAILHERFDHPARSPIPGFLSAESLRKARKSAGIRIAQDDIWSPYGVDRAPPAVEVVHRKGAAELSCSRLGTGPIETLHRLPLDVAVHQLRETSEAHLEGRDVGRNGLGRLTVNYEVREVSRGAVRSPGSAPPRW